MAAGPDGSLYIAGATSSTNFTTTTATTVPFGAPTSPSAPQAFLRRISSDGSRVLFSALLGTVQDTPVGLAVDSQGNAYVAAFLPATAMPTGFQVLDPSGSVGLVKVSAAGDRVLYKALLLENVQSLISLAVDSDGAAYIAGGYRGILIRKIDPSGGSVVYRRQLACTGDVKVGGIAVGSDRSLYLAGTSTCADFPVSPNAYRILGLNPQNGFGFVARFSPSGSDLVYATLLGGDSPQTAEGIAVDSSGRALVVGQNGNIPSLAPMPAQPLGFTPVGYQLTGYLAAVVPDGSNVDFEVLLPTLALHSVAVDEGLNYYVGGEANAGIALAKIDSQAQNITWFSNPPAGQNYGLTTLALVGQQLAFTGNTSSLVFPDTALNPNLDSTLHGFFAMAGATPPITDLALTVQAFAARLDQYGSLSSCRYVVTNVGPVAAEDVLLRPATEYIFQTWQADPPVFLVPNFFFNGPPRASIAHLAPGASAEIDFFSDNILFGPLTCSGSLQTSTAETQLDNNIGSASDSGLPMINFTLGASFQSVPFRGAKFQRDDWPLQTAGPIPFQVLANGQTKITFPSPQNVIPNGTAIFRSWSDGSTDNPRTFSVTDQATGAFAIFDFVPAPQGAMPARAPVKTASPNGGTRAIR